MDDPGTWPPSPPPQAASAPPPMRVAVNRRRTGCRTCRQRKVKCDEDRPLCAQCRRGGRVCEWPQLNEERRARLPKRPNSTACVMCREKKLKCIGDLSVACHRCASLGIACVRQQVGLPGLSPSGTVPEAGVDAGQAISPGDSSNTSTIVPVATSPDFVVPSVYAASAVSAQPADLEHGIPTDTFPLPSRLTSSASTLPAPLHNVNVRHVQIQSPYPDSSPGRRQTPPRRSLVDASLETLQQSVIAAEPQAAAQLSDLPTGRELHDLVQLYFSTVHNFGYYSFIHQLHFNRLLAKNKVPKELTLIMIANALRFAGEVTPENLARADAWADAAIEVVLPRIYQGFGALQLMVLLLVQHYDLHRGNFTSAWLMGANCARMMQMMSLQTFDRTYPAELIARLRLSPLVTAESLRRIAWSTFYADTMVDGGRYGFHIIDEKFYRLQLPCDQASFLSVETVITEPLFPPGTGDPEEEAASSPAVIPQPSTPSTGALPAHQPRGPQSGPLDLSAYILRTAAVRRRALHFAFRSSHREQPVERLAAELAAIEAAIARVISSLPRRFAFTQDNMFLHRDRLVSFLLLHILRHNLYVVAGRAALLVYHGNPERAPLIPPVRRSRIAHALPIAGLIAKGLEAGVTFDPQIGVQAYVALEILLFEPRRLTAIDPNVDPQAPELMEAIPHLLTAIREIAGRSEMVKQLHVEAVHRLLRCECRNPLTRADYDAFYSEYRLVGQAGQEAAEYDFRDFRQAKLERFRRGAGSSAQMARDESLLEYKIDAETAASSTVPSPRLDAADVREVFSAGASNTSHDHEYPYTTAVDVSPPSAAGINMGLASSPHPSLNHPLGPPPPPLLAPPIADNSALEDGFGSTIISSQMVQPWWCLTDSLNPPQPFVLDWSWLIDETGEPGSQTGDPAAFWNQLNRI
ncbi:hypothetical protein SEUCBS139899_001689 [Sporothrix eucalyptigena]